MRLFWWPIKVIIKFLGKFFRVQQFQWKPVSLGHPPRPDEGCAFEGVKRYRLGKGHKDNNNLLFSCTPFEIGPYFMDSCFTSSTTTERTVVGVGNLSMNRPAVWRWGETMKWQCMWDIYWIPTQSEAKKRRVSECWIGLDSWNAAEYCDFVVGVYLFVR